ncbi:hypothetical protein MTO96_003001 [Rhipicephalus appendiculatus]
MGANGERSDEPELETHSYNRRRRVRSELHRPREWKAGRMRGRLSFRIAAALRNAWEEDLWSPRIISRGALETASVEREAAPDVATDARTKRAEWLASA